MAGLKNVVSDPGSEAEVKAVHVDHGQDQSPKLDAIHEHDAVGYREYLQGLAIDISPKEVCTFESPVYNTPLTILTVLSAPLEN